MLGTYSLRMRNALRGALPLCCVCAALVSGSALADSWNASTRIAQNTIREQQQVQKQIDKLDDSAQEAYAEYAKNLAFLEDMQAYTAQVRTLAAQQKERLEDLEKQIKLASHQDRQLVPLMEHMHRGLAGLIARGVPFQLKERQDRLARLREILDNPELSLAARFRSMYETFQIELDYGRTLEAYEDKFKIGDRNRSVTVLRIGRVALYALATDREQSFRWDRTVGDWVQDDSIALGLSRAVRMARKQVAPDLLLLVLDAPQKAPK